MTKISIWLWSIACYGQHVSGDAREGDGVTTVGPTQSSPALYAMIGNALAREAE
jgi:hypothetical protein